MRRNFFHFTEYVFKKIFHLSIDEFLDFFRRPLVWGSGVVLFAVAVVFVTTFSVQRIPDALVVGQVVQSDIKADRDYDIIDEEATATSRQAAVSSVLPVYVFDQELSKTISERVRVLFAETRKKLPTMTAVEIKNFRSEFSQKLGITLGDSEWLMLTRKRFGGDIEKAIVETIESAMKVPLVAERATLDAGKGKGIIVQRTKLEGGNRITAGETKIDDISTLLSTEEARAKLSSPVYAIAKQLIEPNCSFDRQETERREKEAAANVKNVILKVTAGEMIIRNGSRLEPIHIKILEGMQRERSQGNYPYFFMGTFIVVLLFLFIPFAIGEKYIRRFHPTPSDYLFMAMTTLVVLCILRVSLSLAPAIQQALFFPLPDRALTYAIPLGASAMLIRMLLSAESAFIFAIPVAFLVGLFPETGFRFLPFSLISTLAAVLLASKIDRRTMIIRKGLLLGLINAVAMLGLKLLGSHALAEAFTVSAVIWFIIFAFLGGVTSAIIVMIALPVVESLTGYVTDIKLLELANLNHPLLRELIVRAPGTYHHSHLVGILGEAAAEAIGANPLLVRVGAYYHDIGKLKKSSYFIENSKGYENRHEHLTPHMSALIVASHIKDGVEMATAAGLPKSIVDMIPQHHGTRMISFFYEKAKAQSDPNHEKIDPKDFRYPGPKPQTREAAIMMLADVTEASVRSLKEKTSIRIQQTVQRAITDIFAESQLDECELTLQDLTSIGNAFVRILLGIYHQRIEYPRSETSEGEEGNHRELFNSKSSSEPETSDKENSSSSLSSRSLGDSRKT